MKHLFRFALIGVFGFSLLFVTAPTAKAAFVTMPAWQEQPYIFDTLLTGGASAFTFNVYAYVQHDADPLSATFDQYRYNYWVRNLADGSGIGWQSLEIFTVNPVIAWGVDPVAGARNVWVEPWIGESVELAGLPVFAAWIIGPSLAEGARTHLFWYTSYASPGAGVGTGEGVGVGWILGNPGAGGLPAPVPEPATIALLGMGIAGVGFLRRARLKNSQKI